MPRRHILALLTTVALAGLVALGLVPVRAVAASTTLTLNAVADTYVSKHSPDSNYGLATSLSVSHNSYHVLLGFDVSLPTGSSITDVSLRVYSTSAVNSSLIVHPSSNDWGETTVTYANQPDWQAAELSRSGMLPTGGYVGATLPVSSIAGSGPVSYGLNTTAGVLGSLASRETANPPQLLITYLPPSPTPTETGTPSPTPTETGVPAFDHIVVVTYENTSYQNIIGSANAPYINSLAGSGANLTEMYAETHPSQPNYLDFFGGANQGVVDNTGAPYQFTTENIAHQLIAASKTFGAYAEGLPSSGYLGGDTNGYVIHHAPWVNWTNYPATVSHPFTDFPTDFTQLPTVAMVEPNNCNSMHDCSIATGDTWLKTNLDGYAQWAKSHNSLLIVTWDEDDTTDNNHIATVLNGANVVTGAYAQATNHYGLLGLIEDANKLGRVANSTTAAAITAPFTTATTATPSPTPTPT
ncbi:alkaline phosphatase family protein [Pseudarthrobacter sp. N5]|uniref:alkaline phosphatase family protein n=1 Tax=Pseudarthrobacter sp. N5 TaxID=3418416 RepID=UPI003CF5010B